MLRMTSVFQYNQATFLTSAAQLKQLPDDEGFEVAFIGRSNAGKSSAINTITNIKNLARTSRTPGRTQLINLFILDDERRIADLPGYGYAKVPRTIQERWIATTNEYLKERDCLRGLVVVMDIRHPLKAVDQHVLAWCVDSDVPVHVLLTKADKLSYGAARKTLKEVEEALKSFGGEISVQIFSSLEQKGVEEAHAVLDKWFGVEFHIPSPLPKEY